MSENQEKDSNLQQTIEAQQPVEEGEGEQTSADAIKEDIQSDNQETPQQPVEEGEGEGEQTSADAIKEDIQNKNQETPQQPAEESEQASSIEKKLIEEIKTRLIDRNWDEKITSEFDKLGDDKKKDLLVEALKQIYNSNDKNGNNLQQELGLDNNSFTSLIIATVNNNFDSYKELFAEKQPKQMTINLADITENIKNTFIFEQSKAKQAQQQDQEQDQEQAKKPINFQQLVTQRKELFRKKLNEEGAEACRTYYKDNLDNSKENHELDVLALNELLTNGTEEQQKIYNKIASRVFIHGTYGQIKRDQNKLYSLNELTKDYWNFLGIDALEISKKPKNIKVNDISDIINEFPNTKEAQEALKFLCQQQKRNETCSKPQDKWSDNMLNAVLKNLRKDAFKDVTILKNALANIENNDQGFSITEPVTDDMVYFKIVYTHSSETARNELLNSDEFKTKFENLSIQKQKKFIQFFEDIGENKSTDFIKGLQNKPVEKDINSDNMDIDQLADYVNKNGMDAKITYSDPLDNPALNPFYILNEKGAFKNNENILAKETFKLQNSFLGLICTKDKRMLAKTNFGRSVHILDENGKKMKRADSGIYTKEVEAERTARKAAKIAVARAGGNLEAIKNTMPLLKDAEITFTIQGKPIPLSQAVKVCLKVLDKRHNRQENIGINDGKIPEQNTMEQICGILKLNVEGRKFTDEQMQEIKKAISAQIIATQAFVKTFNEKNTALANKPEDKKEQVVQKQQETTTTQEQDQIEQQSANNVPGSLRSFGNGQSQETPQQERVTMNMIAKRLEKQIEQQQEQTKTQNQNDTRPATPVSGQESEQSKPNGTPVPQEVPARTSVEQQTQKEDKNQSKDTSLNSLEEDSSIESSTNNEDTRQQIKDKIFPKRGLDLETQKQKMETKAASKEEEKRPDSKTSQNKSSVKMIM